MTSEKFKINIHFKRINLFIFEAVLPRVSTFLLLPILLRFIGTQIWAEIVLMIAVSEILNKIYLFGFQSSIYRFGNEINDKEKRYITQKLLKRILILSGCFLLFFEFFNSFFWNNLFPFDYGLPMRSAIIISTFSSINIFLIQYIKSLRFSRKLLYGSIIYSISNLLFQFSSIFYLYTNFGKNDRMIVTAYLFSIATASLLRSLYYFSFLNIKIFKKSNLEIINMKEFLDYAKPAAGIGFMGILSTHGSKLILQNNISLDTLGKYFSYLSYVGILFLLFSATQEYLIPKLFHLKAHSSQNIRILIMYLWTLFGYMYFVIFDKLSYVFIPNDYKLNYDIVLLIFLVQIISITRTLPGLYFDIEKKLNVKFTIFVFSTFLYMISVFYIGNLETFLNYFIFYFILLSALYLLVSREFKFLINFAMVQIFNILIFLFFIDYLIKFQNIALIIISVASILLLMKIFRDYEALPNLNSG